MFRASLDTLVNSSDLLQEVSRKDLCAGDRLAVKTCNSVYTIRVEQNGLFSVSGGWFDRKSKSCSKMAILGCTWGGSAIKVDIVAACGLRIEFGNRVITSPIQKIFVFSRGVQN
jgi:hypothetical protein